MFRTLATALVAPLLVATAACATEADGGAIGVETGAEALAALRRAPDAASEAGTGRFELVIALAGEGEVLELRATGVFDSDAQQMAMEMDLGALLAGLDIAGASIPPGFDEPVRFVLDGTTVYLRLPMLDALTGTSGWLSASPEDLGGSGGQSLGLNGGYDPSALLEALRGVADDVEAAGHEEVRGVQTTKYTATVSLDQALEQAPADQRARLEAQLDQLGAGDANVPVEVWVDRDGLARRMTMGFDELLATSGMGGGASVAMMMELFDYGEPVDIELPPADEVTPFTEVAGALGEGFGVAGS